MCLFSAPQHQHLPGGMEERRGDRGPGEGLQPDSRELGSLRARSRRKSASTTSTCCSQKGSEPRTTCQQKSILTGPEKNIQLDLILEFEFWTPKWRPSEENIVTGLRFGVQISDPKTGADQRLISSASNEVLGSRFRFWLHLSTVTDVIRALRHVKKPLYTLPAE